jgi:hypothetical protein
MNLSIARHRRRCVQSWRLATISAVAVRHNDISNALSTASDRFESIYRRKPNRDIDYGWHGGQDNPRARVDGLQKVIWWA